MPLPSPTDTAAAPPPRPFPLTAFLIPAVLALAALSFLPLTRGVASLGFPFQLDREEGYLLDQAVRLARGETIYPALTDYPYVVGNYPPAYPILYAVFVKFFGPTLALGRAINLLAALAIAAGLVWATWSRTRRLVPALLAPCLFVATWDFNEWIAYARVDVLALAFTLAGFLRFLAAPERGGARGTALLFALGLLTRQTLVAAPLACLATLALQRERRAFLSLAVALTAWCAGSYALLFLVTGGKAWSHLVTYNVNPFTWDQARIWVAHLWRFQKFLIVAAVLVGICFLYLRHLELYRRAAAEAMADDDGPTTESETGNAIDERDATETEDTDEAKTPHLAAERTDERPETHPTPEAPSSLLASPLSLPDTAYLLLAFATVFLAGKEGAASNYLLEFHVAMALFIGVHVGRARNLSEGPRRHHVLAVANGILFLCLSFHAVWLGHMFVHRRAIHPPPHAAQRLHGVEVLETIRRIPGEILCEEPIFATLTGREVHFQPFILSLLARQGIWDPARFVEDLRAARFEALVLTQDVFDEDQFFMAWTPSMREAIRAAYRTTRVVGHPGRGRYWVLRPRDAEPPPALYGAAAGEAAPPAAHQAEPHRQRHITVDVYD